jgi:hypothetical protein
VDFKRGQKCSFRKPNGAGELWGYAGEGERNFLRVRVGAWRRRGAVSSVGFILLVRPILVGRFLGGGRGCFAMFIYGSVVTLEGDILSVVVTRFSKLLCN